MQMHPQLRNGNIHSGNNLLMEQLRFLVLTKNGSKNDMSFL